MPIPYALSSIGRFSVRAAACKVAFFSLLACDSEAKAPTETASLNQATATSVPSPTVHHVKATGQLGPGRGTLIVDLEAPENGKLTEGGPLIVAAIGKDLTFPKRLRTRLRSEDLPVRLPVEVSDGAQGPAEIDVYYFWCERGDSGSCQPERAKLYVELDLTGSAAGGEAHFTHRPRTL